MMEYILVMVFDYDNFEPLGAFGSLNESKRFAQSWFEKKQEDGINWSEAQILVYQQQESGGYKIAHFWNIEREVKMVPSVSWRLRVDEAIPPTG